MLYYSASEAGFIDGSIWGEVPADSVEITAEFHAYLLKGQSDGKVIVADENGAPKLVEKPALTAEQATAEKFSLLSLASIYISPLQDAADLGVATEEDVASLKRWKQYRVALNRIEQQPGYPASIEWPAAPK